MQYYVDQKAAAGGSGSINAPFQTISEAARLAQPGDEVIVRPGVYREWVDPQHAGCEEARITYRSEVPGGAVISGAEPLTGWTRAEGSTWTARVDNAVFTDRNPYTTLVSGDWFIATFIAHTGEVFLNDKAMYEVTEKEGVLHPVKSKTSWDPEFSVYTWYCEQDPEKNQTVFYANFRGLNPNEEKVEISARKACFYPSKEGVGFITLSGFVIEKAATQWAPPTAYQEGMVGPHWSKGWIIEDCEIVNAKCSGISLGKYLQPENNNKWLYWKYKDGTQTERDCICQAQREGWTKENIGSHIVRRCHIHDCGQTGIVGHLGGVFSVIEDNHIHHINNRQNLAGAEIGGIKMHAAIDVIFRRNHIHHCTRGLWLDWQAQGTRVTQNVFHDNTLPFEHLMCEEGMLGRGEDIFIEVSHGPTLVDNNLLLSDRALKLPTQGVAVVHNLIAGSFAAVGKGVNNGSLTKLSPRYTPYHVPHRTEVAGFMTILHGDMRFYNNLFVQKPVRPFLQMLSENEVPNEWDDNVIIAGTKPYDGYMTFDEWDAQFNGYCGMGSAASDRYYNPLPVWSEGNVYLGGAKPCDLEKDARVFLEEQPIPVEAEFRDGKWVISTPLLQCLASAGIDAASFFSCEEIDTKVLGMAFEPEQQYENPDGTPIVFDTDLLGRKREKTIAGPLAEFSEVSEITI